MKCIHKIFLVLIIHIIFSCNNKCPDFNDSSDAYHTEATEIMFQKTGLFDKLATAFENASDKDLVIQTDTFIKFPIRNELKADLIKNKFEGEIYIMKKNNNSFLFSVHPTDLIKYNQSEECFYFDALFVYCIDFEMHNNSPNFKYYKIKDNWYLRTSINSL